MLNETYRAMLGNKSVIRETFMYGKQRAAEIGYENVFDYSLGNPSVPCPPEFTAAMQDLLANEEPVNLHGYCPSQGDPEFRTAVAAHLNRTFGLPYAQKDIFPTTGAAGAIAHAVRAVTRPGDEVLTFAPYFPEYGPYVAGTGAVLKVVPPQAPTFQPNLDAFEQMIGEKTTCVLINTPNNPTGAVYSEESLRELADLAVKHDFFIVADEIYEKMVYDGAKHFSVASISREVWERTITVNGFSKAYAMTGWRIGYAAARADVIKEIMAVQSQTTSATSAISQKAALAALQGSQHDMQVMVEEFKRRKDYVVQRLNAMEGIVCPDVKGAFYVYPDVQPYLGKRFGDKVIENAVDLCQYLLDEALISTVPGEAYNAPGKIRISYSNSMENLEKALDRLEHALVQLK